jgi:hypothetical protein
VRKQEEEEDRKPDSLLEEKGRAAKEPEDGPRQACCPLPRPPQQTHDELRALFSDQPTHPADPGLQYFLERATNHGARLEKGEGSGETLPPQAKRVISLRDKTIRDNRKQKN